VSLRDDGRVVAGGPEPDGRAANIFYRVVDRAELDRLLAENEFNRAGLFTASHPRAFAELQREGRAAFGGLFADGTALAVVRSGSQDEALAWLGRAGWDPARLVGRDWSQTL
jgi:hypothetical protein